MEDISSNTIESSSQGCVSFGAFTLCRTNLEDIRASYAKLLYSLAYDK